jgi:hypothetical protein
VHKKQAPVDPAEILKFLSLVSEPGQVIELRLLNVQLQGQRLSVTMAGYFSKRDLLVQSASKYSPYAQGAYITLNPVNPALLARSANALRIAGKGLALSSDTDVISRQWLPVDLDPIRPAGISSTDEEHENAITRTYELREALRVDGFPDPIVADSGNGGHLLYRIDLPTNDDGVIKRCLQALALRFDDDRVKVDLSVYNPSRIWKLYGTFSRKGDSVPDRPHRMARILEVP